MEGQQQHHLFHHKKDAEDANYSDMATAYPSGGPGGRYTENTDVTGMGSDQWGGDYRREEKPRKNLEEFGDAAYSGMGNTYAGGSPGGRYASDGPGGRYSESTKVTGMGNTYAGGGPGGRYSESTEVTGMGSGPWGSDYRKEEKHHKHLEELGELGAAAAGAYAMVTIFHLFSCDKSQSFAYCLLYRVT